MAALIEFKQLIEEYPEYGNPFLPEYVDCRIQDDEGMKNPFRRVTPAIFELKDVKHGTRRGQCVFVVMYCLKNGNLPTGQEMEVMMNTLTKFVPNNTIIINDGIYLPYYVEITYGVICQCNETNFSFAQNPQMQIVREFETLKI